MAGVHYSIMGVQEPKGGLKPLSPVYPSPEASHPIEFGAATQNIGKFRATKGSILR